MIVKSLLLSNWDDKTIRSLRRATLPYGMLKSYMKTFPRARTVVAFSGKQVMGWALIVVHNGKAYPNLFVNKRFRGRGISRVLVEHCLKYYPKVFIAKHDYITRKIFPTFEKLMPGKVYAYNWREVQSEFLSLIANLKT